MTQRRKTIRKEAVLDGIGLHTGRPCRICFVPAGPGSGLRFIRKDISGAPSVRALLSNVSATVRGTNLKNGEAGVSTVEHVLSACSGLGIDDLEIIMDGPEPPAMDGSSLPFARAILAAGISEQAEGVCSILSPEKEVAYSYGETAYRALPSDKFRILVVYRNPHRLIGKQELRLDITPETYLKDIAPARTFGFQEEIDKLRAAGLALGGSLENAVIVGKDRFLTSSGGLRFPDELVRHKALDLIGDLALTGQRPGNVLIEAVCGGHLHNINFARLLSAERQVSGIITTGEKST